MGAITTHILDTMHGLPARGVSVVLEREREVLVSTVSNEDGRCNGPLLEAENFKNGCYRLVFGVGEYYRSMGVHIGDPAFLEHVVVDFGVSDSASHYHVPLLVSPYGYSTYRGS